MRDLSKHRRFFFFTNERPGSDPVIWGPLRGLEKNRTRWRKQKNSQPDGHGDSLTNSAQRGQVGENIWRVCKKKQGRLKKQTLLSPKSPTRPPMKPVWSTNDMPMCQCVPMNSERTQKVKNTSGCIRPPKDSSEQFFFENISLHWIITTLSWTPICSIVFWPNH